ncbi:magnesium-translocating P-type ATPase [Luteitalea sp.]|uniref:magnesium-translocating P-type ATPase n=1 Tax=Luteitalea sp. TaxID=2004800 RepID=UPI0025C44104|nr:magnesium-translocating P-type ATPase [Luteitalea sp.]
MTGVPEAGPYWSRDAGELTAALGSGVAGLTAADAAARLTAVGPNTVEDARRLGPLRLLWRQVESPLVLILIFAAVVSLGLAEWVDAAIILAIVVGSTLLGFSQEYRASAAIADLKTRLALTCRVVRDGADTVVGADQLVPGDRLLLSAGNLIPADGRILEAKDFLVSEASMTGESFPVEKQPGVVPADTPLGRRTNVVFLGASVRSGTATVLVVDTGRRTAFGAIGARLRAREPETSFARGLRQFGYLLIRLMVLIVVSVLSVNLLLHRPLVESLLFSVALAVGLSPELLPAIVSVTLSAGARAMCAEGVIVRRLDAIENLGSMTVLCTDKTGTLTEGTTVLADATDPAGRSSPAVRQLAFLNASFETGIDNPLDAALVAAGTRAGLSTTGYGKVDEIPYDFLRKRLTIVVAEERDAGRHLVITKGAFANVLAVCTHVAREDVALGLTGAIAADLAAYYEAQGRAGFRVLALATRRVSARATYQRDDETGMVFAGFLLFVDPPRSDAARVLADLAHLGVGVKIITGDNRFVTRHLAAAVGLDPASMMTGEALATLDDEALWHTAPGTALFAEIDPQQKERIVRALQRTGHSVGYLGDGINDAPALRAADVGISVDQAVDVARESADIILLRRDLDVLRTGVEGGRRTFVNTLKYISITTSANFGNMVSMAIAAPLLPFLPLLAKQILLNNFLSDVPSMAISTDRVDVERVTQPQRWDIAQVRRYMIVFGLVSSVFDLLTFAVLRLILHAGEAAFQTTWFVVSLLTELGVVLILRTRGPAWRSRPSGLLLWTTAGAAAVALVIPFLGSWSRLFGFVPLSPIAVGAVLGIVGSYLMATEVTKRWLFRTATPQDKGASPQAPRPGGGVAGMRRPGANRIDVCHNLSPPLASR